MKYITKIDKTHVVELNNRNVKIKEDTSKSLQVFILNNSGDYISVDKNTLKLSPSFGCGGGHLDQYVVALEIAKLVLETEERENENE